MDETHEHTPSTKGFSWKQALGHAGALAAVVLAMGVALVSTGDVSDPRRYGQGLGGFVGLVFGLGLAGSWLWQRAHRRAAIAVGLLGLGLGVAALFAVRQQMEPLGPQPLRASDRAPLEEVRDASGALTRLRHPHLGFELKLPGGSRFAPVDAERVRSSLDQSAEQHAWGYQEPDGTSLFVLLSRGRFGEVGMKGFVAGFKGESERDGGHRVVRESASEDEARIDVEMAGGQGYMRARAREVRLHGEPVLIAIVATTPYPHPEGLDDLLDALVVSE